MDLYIHSPIRLHGIVLSSAQGQLSLPFTNRFRGISPIMLFVGCSRAISLFLGSQMGFPNIFDVSMVAEERKPGSAIQPHTDSAIFLTQTLT
jgi:hypothetical protein